MNQNQTATRSPETISAIVPSHGHRQFLAQRLDSITAQTRVPDELIVIDDGSRDGSAEWLRAWRSPLPMQLECRAEASGNPFAIWNAGAARATGDWLWIAESDDACRPEMLATLLAAAKQHPDAALVFCQSELIDEAGAVQGTFARYTNKHDSETWRRDFVLDGSAAVARHLLARNPIPNVSACLISRRAWLAAGGADSSLNLCSDWLTYARLLRHGSLGFVAAALNQHRHHPDTQRARTARLEQVHQGSVARSRIAELHGIADLDCEYARRLAWDEAAMSLRIEPARLPEALGAKALGAARRFDPRFDQRATNVALRAWDHCDVFFDASGAFTTANQRRLPVGRYHAWDTYRFRGGTGRVRFDPTTRKVPCQLRRIAIVAPVTGERLWAADARSNFAGLTTNDGVQLQLRDDALFIVSAHDDPQLLLPAEATRGHDQFDLEVEMFHPLE